MSEHPETLKAGESAESLARGVFPVVSMLLLKLDNPEWRPVFDIDWKAIARDWIRRAGPILWPEPPAEGEPE